MINVFVPLCAHLAFTRQRWTGCAHVSSLGQEGPFVLVLAMTFYAIRTQNELSPHTTRPMKSETLSNMACEFGQSVSQAKVGFLHHKEQRPFSVEPWRQKH